MAKYSSEDALRELKDLEPMIISRVKRLLVLDISTKGFKRYLLLLGRDICQNIVEMSLLNELYQSMKEIFKLE